MEIDKGVYARARDIYRSWPQWKKDIELCQGKIEPVDYSALFAAFVACNHITPGRSENELDNENKNCNS
jgi:hypothetical protein